MLLNDKAHRMESQAITCRQCRKEIKTEAYKCIPCEKIFHPSCVKLHKVQNREKETISCKGAVEIYLVNVEDLLDPVGGCIIYLNI